MLPPSALVLRPVMNKSLLARIGAGLAIVAVIVGIAIYWLTRPTVSDRQQILDMFLATQDAVERKSVSGVMRHISEDYDDGTYTKRALTRLAVSAFREGEPFNVLTVVRALQIKGNQAVAEVEVKFWVGRGPPEHVQHLTLHVAAEKKRGKWQVTRARGWQQAQEAF